MHAAIQRHLNDDDDPELWQVVADEILADFEAVHGVMVEIGCCSHWLRPHQSRWRADGGFAWPTGYGGTGYSRFGLPLFDWSIVLTWTGLQRAVASGRSLKPSLRIAVPARTKWHQQAAVHTLWTDHGKRIRFYGFRKKAGRWWLTATSSPREEVTEQKRANRSGKKDRVVLREKQRRLKGDTRR